MKTQRVTVQSRRVTTEGDELYYEVCGQEQPLLMIPGGTGDGGYYAAVADILSDEYKVITYDHRANARSTMNDPQNFEISQQSRDAVAVLSTAGEQSAFFFWQQQRRGYCARHGEDPASGGASGSGA
jgi:pimeloyl-ACP methyl ester carboxylesterase